MALVMGGALLEYDEAALNERLARLPEAARVAFAASCAERLVPVYEWAAGSSADQDVAVVRAALDLGWSASASTDQIEQAQAEVEALVPDEDDEGFIDVALAQNAVGCVAYVLRARLSHDVQDAVWAARQLYEAADHIVQLGAPSRAYIRNLELETPVQIVLRGLGSALGDLEGASTAQMQTRARADGEALLAQLKGE